jgi:hypothetical protein
MAVGQIAVGQMTLSQISIGQMCVDPMPIFISLLAQIVFDPKDLNFRRIA